MPSGVQENTGRGILSSCNYHVPHMLYAVDIGLEMCLSILFSLSYYLAQVASCYECLPRSVVRHFVNLCEVCSLQRPQRNQAPLKPIISSGFMTRGQVCIVTCCLLYNNCLFAGGNIILVHQHCLLRACALVNCTTYFMNAG